MARTMLEDLPVDRISKEDLNKVQGEAILDGLLDRSPVYELRYGIRDAVRDVGEQ